MQNIEVHPKGNDIYKASVKKTAVSLRIDNDVLAALKATGNKSSHFPHSGYSS